MDRFVHAADDEGLLVPNEGKACRLELYSGAGLHLAVLDLNDLRGAGNRGSRGTETRDEREENGGVNAHHAVSLRNPVGFLFFAGEGGEYQCCRCYQRSAGFLEYRR